MIITDLKVENNNIIFSVDEQSAYEPYIMRRVSPDLWRYHNRRIPIHKADVKSYIIDENVLFSLFDLSASYCICDVICFDSYSEREGGLYFDDAEKYKDFSTEIIYEKSFGKITASFYRNGSNSLSVRLSALANNSFQILKLSEDENYVNFRLKSTSDLIDFELFLACRENIKHDFCYRAFVKVPISLSGNRKYSYFRISKKSLLHDIFIKNKDIFDFVVKTEQYVLPCFAENNELSTNYYNVKDGFEACCFISEDKYASMYVRENFSIKNGNKIKVAILGSCFSKEAFHSLEYLNPDYKNFYQNGLISFHSSIISVVSEPIQYNKNDFEGSLDKKLIELYGDRELSKTFLSDLQLYKPDYLIVDLYIEAAASIFEIEYGCYFTDSFYFRGTHLIEKLHPKRKLLISTDERFDLFRQSVKKFRERIEKIMPLNKIILVKARRAIDRSDNGVVSRWPEYEYIKYANIIWDKCDEIFEQIIPEAQIIDMRNEKKYISQKQSPLTYSPQHLVSDYYKDLLNKFNKIVLKDIIDNN